MEQMTTTGPGELDTSMLADQWVPYRCAQNKRTVDVNHRRRKVRYFCDRCRRTHELEVGTLGV